MMIMMVMISKMMEEVMMQRFRGFSCHHYHNLYRFSKD